MEVGNADFVVVVVSARTRNMLNKAFTAALCSAILYDEPKPSDNLTPEGRKRPMLNIGAWEFVPVDARILVVSSCLTPIGVYELLTYLDSIFPTPSTWVTPACDRCEVTTLDRTCFGFVNLKSVVMSRYLDMK
jgi:hypothetical protein